MVVVVVPRLCRHYSFQPHRRRCAECLGGRALCTHRVRSYLAWRATALCVGGGGGRGTRFRARCSLVVALASGGGGRVESSRVRGFTGRRRYSTLVWRRDRIGIRIRRRIHRARTNRQLLMHPPREHNTLVFKSKNDAKVGSYYCVQLVLPFFEHAILTLTRAVPSPSCASAKDVRHRPPPPPHHQPPHQPPRPPPHPASWSAASPRHST